MPFVIIKTKLLHRGEGKKRTGGLFYTKNKIDQYFGKRSLPRSPRSAIE